MNPRHAAFPAGPAFHCGDHQMCGAGYLLPPSERVLMEKVYGDSRDHLPEHRQPDEEQPEQPGGNAGRCQSVSAPANYF